MKVSIIVPVYNTEKYLAECLGSLARQTYKNIEIVVVDDGSTDNSRNIAEAYAKDDDRVKVIAKRHAGTNLARKKGVENATGEYCMFIDSDDWIEIDAIEKLVKILKDKPYDIIKFNAVNEPDGQRVPGIDLGGERKKELSMDEVRQKALETKLLRSLAYEIVNTKIAKNTKNFARAISYGEDYLANLEIIDQAASFLAIDDVFYHYRKNTSSTTKAKDRATVIKNFEDTKQICEGMLAYAEKWEVTNSRGQLAFMVLDTYRVSICRLFESEEVVERDFYPLVGSIYNAIERVKYQSSLPRLLKTLAKKSLLFQLKHSSEILYIFTSNYDRLWARRKFYRPNRCISKYMRGRLGNQLFQYATLRQIQEENGNTDRLRLNFSKYIYSKGFDNDLRGFNTKPYEEVEKIRRSPNQVLRIFYYRVRKRIHRAKHPEDYYTFRANLENRASDKLQKAGIYWKEDGKLTIRPSDKKHKIAIGHFESSANFDKIRPKLLEELTPKKPPLKKNQALYEVIENTNSVCVSVRRGDFVTNPEFAKKFNVCGPTYFKQAVAEIKKRVENPVFVIFSDDVEWCRDNLEIDGKVYYEDGTDPVWEKLRLMYSCKHFIISNSTFSWWAQYLSRNAKKVVVAPKVWQKDGFHEDIYDKRWILVDNGGKNG